MFFCLVFFFSELITATDCLSGMLWSDCCICCLFFPPLRPQLRFFSSSPHRRDVSSQTTACELVFRFVWFCCIIPIQHTSPGSQIFTFMRSAFFFFLLPLVVRNRGKRNVWKKLGHETAHKLVNQPVLLNLPWHKKKHARFSRGFKQVLSLAKWRD